MMGMMLLNVVHVAVGATVRVRKDSVILSLPRGLHFVPYFSVPGDGGLTASQYSTVRDFVEELHKNPLAK